MVSRSIVNRQTPRAGPNPSFMPVQITVPIVRPATANLTSAHTYFIGPSGQGGMADPESFENVRSNSIDLTISAFDRTRTPIAPQANEHPAENISVIGSEFQRAVDKFAAPTMA